jgi:hypothetical protein
MINRNMKQPHGEKMSERSPLARLVLFMVCLAVAGSVLGWAHYLVIDLPAQKNLPAPENAQSSGSNCALCLHNCEIDPDRYSCEAMCKDLECAGIIL